MATLLADFDVFDVSSGTSASFTPTADALLVILIAGTSGTSGGVTITDNLGASSLTYTEEAYEDAGAYRARVAAVTAPVGSSPSSMQITATFTDNPFYTMVAVIEVEDYDSAQGVVQAYSDTGDTNSGAYSGSLTSTTTAGNELVAAGTVISTDVADVAPGSGYTELLEYVASPAANARVNAAQFTDVATSSVDWAALNSSGFGNWGVVAVEVGVSAVGGGPDIAPLYHHQQTMRRAA
ncbi:MAG: hypothetical protein V2J24_20175 [Pseudomonadales bacterium]|nr:hypothetical protein [Pseudomonadales bacterium]